MGPLRGCLLAFGLVAAAPSGAHAAGWYLVSHGARSEPLPEPPARRPVSVQVWAVVEGRPDSEASLDARAAVLRAVMETRQFAAVYPESLPAAQQLLVLLRSERPTWGSLMRVESELTGGVSYEDH